jgi:TolB protein
MELYLVNADGSHLTRLTNTAESEEFPTWSPDGQWIAFQTVSQEGRQSNIFKMRADGSDLTPLTTGPTYDDIPAWSPDGLWIAFWSTARSDPASKQSSPATLFKIRADGSTQVAVPVMASQFAWAPQ